MTRPIASSRPVLPMIRWYEASGRSSSESHANIRGARSSAGVRDAGLGDTGVRERPADGCRGPAGALGAVLPWRASGTVLTWRGSGTVLTWRASGTTLPRRALGGAFIGTP